MAAALQKAVRLNNAPEALLAEIWQDFLAASCSLKTDY